MLDTLTNPLPFDQFRKDVESNTIAKTIGWADHEVYVPFIRYTSGEEVALLFQERLLCHVNASYMAGAEQILSSTVISTHLQELVIKTLTLGELFCTANFHKLGINIFGEDHRLNLGSHAMCVLAEFTLYDDKENEKSLYSVTAFSFENDDCTTLLPKGAVQLWMPSHLSATLPWSSKQEQALLIFDDRLDWTNPRFPPLPDNAKGLSQLPTMAQKSFQRMQLSPLPIKRDTPQAPAVPAAIYHNSLLAEEKAKSFSRLLARVDKEIVPKAINIKLNVTHPSARSSAQDRANSWELQVSFISPRGGNIIFASELVDTALCKANAALPNTVGTQCANHQLRQRIVKHITWMLFQHGRDLNFLFYGFFFDLQGLLPCSIINGYGQFQPDYTDDRFPCLARFSFGEYQVPVMLLGADKDNYICMPLASKALPETDAPRQIPHRSDLIDRSTGYVELKRRIDKLLIPKSLIDFPDHWYQGERISNKMVIDQFISRMEYKELPENTNQPIKDESGSPMLWLMGCVLIMALLIMWDFLL